ncbi:MAG TPA: MAB_1171c family putative transporter [Actinophytocola sp.]|uniref:MAB_1171c family putative transporter n=1 Tax=Actinophytocola sp. TaxID=1872138 RepID=UPI002DDD23E0|nr:MAB_1171c family putative transporter [Actinophytocola sp.]HEV2779741.1 MAB_1171c family putative transporter [Actinophytocola sp.]
MIALLALQAIATCVVLAVLLYLLVRAPGNVPLRAVTVTIASFVLTVVFGPAATTGAIFLGLEPILSRLIQHLGMLVCGYSLIAFFLFSALDRPAARRRAMWQAIPVGAAAVILTADTVLMPAGIRDAAATLAFARPGATPLDELTIALQYVTPNLYLAYAFVCALLWIRRYARGAEPRLRHGLALTAVGMVALVLGLTVFILATLASWAGVALPPWLFGMGLLLVLPGSVAFMLGFAYPAAVTRLAALRVWWHHRTMYHRLAPLWTLLHRQFPEDALGRVPAARWRDALSLRGVHRRYYRRVIECRDGLVRLSPYLAGNGHPGDLPLADRLHAGLRAHASGTPVPARAVPIAIPAADGLDADVHELITLSDALRSSASAARHP